MGVLTGKKKKFDFWKGAILFIVGEFEILLGIRFFLKFIDADSSSKFVSFIYQTTEPIVKPFEGIFSSEVFRDVSEIEFNTMFAMVVLALLGFAAVSLVELFDNRKKY